MRNIDTETLIFYYSNMANEPGQGDERASIAEILKLAAMHNMEAKLAIARAKETPTKKLAPEAHEDALKAKKALWIEGTSLLGKDPYCQIETPKHKMWNIYGKKFVERMDDLPADTEFTIFGPMNRSVEHVNEEGVEHTNHVQYAVTPNGVIMVERNWANAVPSDKLLRAGEPRTPKGLGLQKTEIGRDEINEVLKILQTRVAHYPNQG